MVEHLEFDPEGDLLLVLLRYPSEEESDEQEENAPSTDPMVVDQPQSDTQPQEANEDQSEGSEDVTTESKNSASDVSKDTEDESSAPPSEIEMLVSSRHLMLSSPVFKAMLQHSNFAEGKELQDSKKVTIPLPEDDPDAFAIILDIVHGRNRKVPKEVNLDLMGKLAVLVDKYQMLEVVEMFSDIWIDGLRVNLPKNFTADAVPWLGIAWVFKKEVEFRHLTSIIEQEGDSKLGKEFGEEVPVPELVIDTLKKRREEILFNTFAIVDQTIKRYQRPGTLCPRPDGYKSACDAMLLGSLIKDAGAVKIWPPPSPPYRGVTFISLAEKIKNLQVMALCDNISRVQIAGCYPVPAHGLKALINDMMVAHEKTLCGLDITDFGPKKKKEEPNGQGETKTTETTALV